MKIYNFLFLFLSLTSFAQSKTGTIDIDYILSKMPELSSVQQQIETYGKGLDADLTKKYEAYNVLIEAYKAEEATFTIAQKQQKQEEISVAEEDITKFQKNGSQLLTINRDEILKPLYQRIGASLEKISKAEGFSQVFQTGNTIVYLDQNYDITLKVLKDLGIEVKEGE